jgi:hypothetical protein
VRGHESRSKRGGHPEDDAFGENEGVETQLPDRERKVDIVDRAGHEPSQPGPKAHPQGQTGGRADGADNHGLPEDPPEYLPPSHSKRAQRADERTLLHHYKAHGVIDQKGPNQERKEA